MIPTGVGALQAETPRPCQKRKNGTPSRVGAIENSAGVAWAARENTKERQEDSVQL
jgi:hypothetical protein